MEIRVQDYVGRFLNAKVERRLASDLRERAENDRMLFIIALLDSKMVNSFPVALWLAKTYLKQKLSFEAILTKGLNEADASIIKFWLDAVMQTLGFRKIVQLLQRRLPDDPASVIRARYWLQVWLPNQSEAAKADFSRLNDAIDTAFDNITFDDRMEVEYAAAIVLNHVDCLGFAVGHAGKQPGR